MNIRDRMQLENTALLLELSRQVAHDFSNFVYNLVLQIEIQEHAAKPTLDWGRLKVECRRIASLLGQWESFHARLLTTETGKVDIHEMLRTLATFPAYQPMQLTPEIRLHRLVMPDGSAEVRHLLHLLLEEAFQVYRQAPDPKPGVSMSTAQIEGKAHVRFQTAGCSPFVDDPPEDGKPGSLLEAACNSLAIRLGAAIRREQADSGEKTLTVELALTPDL